MLPRQNRLPSVEISKVMRSGKRIAGNGVTLIFDSRLPASPAGGRGNDSNSRFSFIVSTKVDKRAVVRNRIRRLLRESVSHILPSFKFPVDGVCIGSRGLITLTKNEVESRVQELLKRI